MEHEVLHRVPTIPDRVLAAPGQRGKASIGWSGYGTAALDGSQVVYFTSTGLLPAAQGRGLVPALQRDVISTVAKEHPSASVATEVRNRNPHSYRLAERTFGSEICPGGRRPRPDSPL
jgi:hypothetical protein